MISGSNCEDSQKTIHFTYEEKETFTKSIFAQRFFFSFLNHNILMQYLKHYKCILYVKWSDNNSKNTSL